MVNAAVAAYRTADVGGITQRDLIVKLYLAAEAFLRQAATDMRAVRPAEAHESCTKGKAIFIELLATLNLDQGGQIAQRLRALYVFFIAAISESNLKKDASKIDGILPIIATLREAWQAIPNEHANTSALPPGEHQHAIDLRT